MPAFSLLNYFDLRGKILALNSCINNNNNNKTEVNGPEKQLSWPKPQTRCLPLYGLLGLAPIHSGRQGGSTEQGAGDR